MSVSKNLVKDSIPVNFDWHSSGNIDLSILKKK